MKKTFRVGKEVLSFEITNKTIFDIDERFDNFGNVINGVMYGKNLYNNALKVMVCACISKRLDDDKNEIPLTIDELMEKLEPDQVISEIVPFATDLYLDYRGIKQSSDDKEDEKEDKKK